MKLQQPEGILSIHICTKDRPEQLGELLADIDAVVPKHKRVFVYDDSVLEANRQQNSKSLDAMPYPTVHIDETARQDLLSRLPWPSEPAEIYADYGFKELGKPGWDLAGVRSFAHFVGSTTTDPFNSNCPTKNRLPTRRSRYFELILLNVQVGTIL